jgi:predicted molibdopterin-dependent oxidoreductase YjgC
MIRLVADQSARIKRADKVVFTFDGNAVQGRQGESLVAALMRGGHLRLRDAPNDGAARGAFCCMGLCQECVVRIDGRITEACRAVVFQGLVVERAG